MSDVAMIREVKLYHRGKARQVKVTKQTAKAGL